MTKTECLQQAIEKATAEEEPMPEPAKPQVLTKERAERKWEKSHSRRGGESVTVIAVAQKPMKLNGFDI